MFSAPRPRSKLYTNLEAYVRGLGVALFSVGAGDEGNSALERTLGEICGGCHAVVTPMARVGIYLSLKHTIRKGQKVILSPYTISDVVNMVLCAGGVPVFADIEDGGSCNIDARHVERLLESETDVGAVLVTHFYGLVCDIEPIVAACKPRGIPVIEDAAQAFGAELNGKLAGTIGDAGIFSFGLLKNVTGFLGGAVVTRDERLATAIRQTLQGFSGFQRKMLLKKIVSGAAFDVATAPGVFDSAVYWLFRYAYLHDIDFFNNKLETDSNPKAYSDLPTNYAARMSGAQAKIIQSQIPRHRKQTAERIATAQVYAEGLKDISGLTLPPARTDRSHIYFYYPIQCENRDRLGRFMTQRLRDIQISHHRNCASLPCFSAYHGDCPNAERAAGSVIYLPTYPGYGAAQAQLNVDTIRAYFREGNSWT